MNLQPLKITDGLAGRIVIVCKLTGKKALWNAAAHLGWVADLDGNRIRLTIHAGIAPHINTTT